MVVRTVVADDSLERDEATASAAVMTGEELLALVDVGRAELVEGELIRMVPTGHTQLFE